MAEEEWNAGHGEILGWFPWGDRWVHPARPDNLSLHSHPRPGPWRRDGADGGRRTTSSSASPMETRNHACRPSRRARDPVGTRSLESSPATSDEDTYPRPAKAQQAHPCPEDLVYEAAIPLRAQAQRCVEICGQILDQFDAETAGLKAYLAKDDAARIWKLKLKKLGERGQDKDKNVDLQVMSLGGYIHRMEVAADGLQRQVAVSGGDGHDSYLAALKPIMEQAKAIKTLSAVARSSDTQCKQLIERLKGLVKLLETEEGDKPFALFRFRRTELPEHDSWAEPQQQQNNQEHKHGQQDKNNITENQNGKNGRGKKNKKRPENDQPPGKEDAAESKEAAENEQAAENQGPPEGEQPWGLRALSKCI